MNSTSVEVKSRRAPLSIAVDVNTAKLSRWRKMRTRSPPPPTPRDDYRNRHLAYQKVVLIRKRGIGNSRSFFEDKYAKKLRWRTHLRSPSVLEAYLTRDSVEAEPWLPLIKKSMNLDKIELFTLRPPMILSANGGSAAFS